MNLKSVWYYDASTMLKFKHKQIQELHHITHSSRRIKICNSTFTNLFSFHLLCKLSRNTNRSFLNVLQIPSSSWTWLDLRLIRGSINTCLILGWLETNLEPLLQEVISYGVNSMWETRHNHIFNFTCLKLNISFFSLLSWNSSKLFQIGCIIDNEIYLFWEEED